MRRAYAVAGVATLLGVAAFYRPEWPTSEPYGGDQWRLAAGGHRPVRLATLTLPTGRYEFRAYVDEGGLPNVVFRAAGQGGARRLVAVGERGGWALEPHTMRAGDRDVVFGAAIPDATTVVARTDAGETSAETVAVEGLPFRWFVFATAAGSHVAGANEIVALDRSGRLLGRPHDNVDTAAAPDPGPYDGLWDRAHSPAPSR